MQTSTSSDLLILSELLSPVLLPVLVVGCVQHIPVQADGSKARMLRNACDVLTTFILKFCYLIHNNISLLTTSAFDWSFHSLAMSTCAPGGNG